MQNFFADMFEKIAEPRGFCSDGSDMYGCIGCDGECLYTCSAECSSSSSYPSGEDGCSGSCEGLCGGNCRGSCGINCSGILSKILK